MLSWWKRRKCTTCKKVLKKGADVHEIRLQSVDGISEFEICGDCADFWDKSAEVLQRRGEEKKDAGD
jgi:hypothetical protein